MGIEQKARVVAVVFVRVILILYLTLLCACVERVPPLPASGGGVEEGSPPVIDDVFTVSHILSNKILRIYIEGKDIDKDLQGILVVVSQLGSNVNSTQFVLLRNGDKAEFKGFVTIDIPALDTIERLKVEMTLVDRKGFKSNRFEREITIGFDIPEKIPEKWMSQKTHKLGHVFFDFIRDQERQYD